MKDLNYQLKQLCHQNRDGSYSTRSKRAHHLMQIANQSRVLGFHSSRSSADTGVRRHQQQMGHDPPLVILDRDGRASRGPKNKECAADD